jgi:dipeptidyl aminopeptidase/acylaminoacyl peptidase
MRRILVAAAALFALSLSAELTVDQIMRGPQYAGYAPRALRWSPDGKSAYFEWKQHTDPVEENFDTYVVGRDGKGLRKLTDEEAKHAPPARGDWTRDRMRNVHIDNGDVFLYDGVANRRRALTDTTEAESSAAFTHDEKAVTFVRRNNLFVVSLTDGSVTQLTNIVAADERGPHVSLFEDENKDKTDSQKWVAEEAKKLSDVLARRSAERKEEEAKRKAEIAIAPMKLKKGESVGEALLSPDGKYAIVLVSVEPEGSIRPNVPSYVTESGYTVDLPARRKVGDRQGTTRIASISTADGKINWLQHDLKVIEPQTEKKEDAVTKGQVTEEEQRTTERQEGEATAEKTEAKEPPARELQVESVLFSDDGKAAVLSVRAIDNKDSWLLAFEPVTAKTRVLFNEHDDAWVQWSFGGSLGFIPNTQTVWFLSEKSGWMHLWTVPFAGGNATQLTKGEWEVDEVELAHDRKSFLLTASKESLFEDHYYRLPICRAGTAGCEQTGVSALQKLTTEPGRHDAALAPDGKTLADIYSYSNKPPEVHVAGTRVTTSHAPDFTNYPWLDVPIVRFPARDGKSVPARIYKPANWNGGPAVIFVHGAGYLQNVHRGWSSYFREYMFHHLLMERGYLVLDTDYRASAGYGRDWRTAIYRHMGGADLNDHLDAAKWLVSEHKVDPKRIGIYGGSYGGFITLMAMFTSPGTFAAGAALRPVTDWAHYNHGYTSNILNTPQKDPEAYRKSSPIYFAEGLQGALLICHGVIDVNVHFQDTVRLAQRLMELRKENWEVAMYPLEDHGFVEPTSWADEYKRILALFERELK